MSATALRAEIQNLVDTFVGELEELVRKAALETVTQLLQPGAGGVALPSAKRRTAAEGLAAARSAARSPRATKAPAKVAKSAGRVRRSADQIEAAGERIVRHVEANPGVKAEEIRAALSLPKNEWTLTVKRLVDGGKLTTKGEKRATQYFTRAAPRFGVIRRPGRGPAPSVAGSAADAAS